MTKQPKSRAVKDRAVPDRFEAGWLAKMDTRMALVRELRARLDALANDLGGDLSYQERSLAERAIFVEYILAKQERDLIEGAEFDQGAWVQSVNALSGLFNRLGLQRRQTDVPDLASYLASKEGKQ
ncbi:MAG: hypothetical protein FKY71_15120 [Spiribacter salinus]|uniref:Uncharacterized protein n=1 Tax=Spiribacter salinus TaxID=1335746 RepID=A0A540VPS4_9GAMM|nr:MAG: hypothetical protein FKY71_15120 [Spiribacter salinus]